MANNYLSVDNPSLLAQTVLGIMLMPFNGGSKFLTKLIPVSKLISAFLFEQPSRPLHLYQLM